ncbi:hypothetical protein L486_04319 [Kwoniella mangroviensis CBS 10435]|uniref:Uncharacterized protein n=1 Tax=Kwoniella mangroviensis CBS 10435 TaxID=1331196 RepID=A0A1B9IRW6_9TREE|nr:hypothetical protein L486_04319 [Kwoniella mangroviensis CBS 10435]
MPRPGQAQARRKRALEEMESGGTTSYTQAQYDYPDGPSKVNFDNDELDQEQVEIEDIEDEGLIDNPRSQCLPVGVLPEDFSGEPIDGSQYLAMANRDNQNLPFVKTVINPYRSDLIGPTLPSSLSASNKTGSSSRHPALPKESWQELFPIHYQGYRKHIQSQLSSSSSSTSSYPSDYPPIPPASRRSDWYAYINGYQSNPKKGKPKGKQKAKPALTEEEMMNAAMGEGMDVDEEAAVEAEVVEDVVIGKTSRGNEKVVGAPREPLLGVLRKLNSSQALLILSHFAHWLSESIEQSPPPLPGGPDLPPDQPGISTPSPSSRHPQNTNHLSSNYFNWIFSLLLITDTQLSSEEISILRDLARASMKVAGHRYIIGVVGKHINEGWVLGEGLNNQQRTVEANGQDRTEVPGEKTEIGDSVDQILARCWLIIHAVAIGWGQKDLLFELDNLFT